MSNIFLDAYNYVFASKPGTEEAPSNNVYSSFEFINSVFTAGCDSSTGNDAYYKSLYYTDMNGTVMPPLAIPEEEENDNELPIPEITEAEIARSTCYPKLDKFKDDNNVKEITLDNGLTVLTTVYTKLNGAQPEWLDLQKYMQQAAEDLGLELVYGEISRTVAVSNAGNVSKGAVVAKGGSSPHNYGVAADILLFDKSTGKMVNKVSSLQEKFANRVKELSSGRIAWGGDWSKANEEHHFELRDWKENYKRPENLVG